jgi:hypothetical protein
MKQLHQNLRVKGLRRFHLRQGRGEGGGGRERALLKNAVDSHFGVVVGM